MTRKLRDTTVATQTVAGSESGGSHRRCSSCRCASSGSSIPAIPVDVHGMADTVSRLAIRVKQREQAPPGPSKMFTIGGSTARAYNFLYGSGEADKKAARRARRRTPSWQAIRRDRLRPRPTTERAREELALIAVGGGDHLTNSRSTIPSSGRSAGPRFPMSTRRACRISRSGRRRWT